MTKLHACKQILIFFCHASTQVIGHHSLMAHNVTYRKSRASPNATLPCLSLAGQFLPVEWAKDGIAIPLGSGSLNHRYRYELHGGNLTIVDAYKLSAGEHTFECRINAHALQAATQTAHHTLRTMSVPVKLKVLPKASSKWDNSQNNDNDNNNNIDDNGEEYKTAVVHVADIMQSDAQAQRVDDGESESKAHTLAHQHERSVDSSAADDKSPRVVNRNSAATVDANDEDRLADEPKTSLSSNVEAARDSSSSRPAQWLSILTLLAMLNLKSSL